MNCHVHVARRRAPHPRVVVLVDAEGRRTILDHRAAAPAERRRRAPLGEARADLDAVYFTGSDPGSLRLARRARRLLVTARRAAMPLRRRRRVADVVVGSATDPRENEPIHTYCCPRPSALVLTDGPRAMVVSRAAAVAGGAPILSHVDPPPAVSRVRCDYGAGDSFAAALTFFVAHSLSVEEACRRAGPHGAAVLLGEEPLSAQLYRSRSRDSECKPRFARTRACKLGFALTGLGGERVAPRATVSRSTRRCTRGAARRTLVPKGRRRCKFAKATSAVRPTSAG